MDAQRVAHASQVIGEAARARMLLALAAADGLPARALAHEAEVSPQTASWHLSKLLGAGLVSCERRGRHRYYRLRTPHVAHALEALAALAPHAPPAPHAALAPHAPPARSAREDHLHEARTCYDHLGGTIAVALADALVAKGWIRTLGTDFEPTVTGSRALRPWGINFIALRGRRRSLARGCPDWSDSRPHVGGALGAALMRAFLELGWLREDASSRAVHVTDAGREGLAAVFDVRA